MYQWRATGGTQALLLLAGVIVWGGGWFVHVPVLPRGAESANELPPDRWDILWQPEPGLLKKAAA